VKIQVLQNISFEGPDYIKEIAEKYGHELFITRLFEGEQPIPATDYDMLVIMGGPMNIYEEIEYPWLGAEKKTIELAIGSNKVVLGICLGAQLIADVLGAQIYKNEEREIGWFPITRSYTGSEDAPLQFIPDTTTVFHWHSETFDLPGNAIRLFSSEATENQAFLYEEKVLALQFHLEINKSTIKDLVHYYEDDLKAGKFIMDKKEMLKLYKEYKASNRKMLRSIFKYFLEEEKH